MGTATYGGKGSKESTRVSGERLMGAAVGSTQRRPTAFAVGQEADIHTGGGGTLRNGDFWALGCPIAGHLPNRVTPKPSTCPGDFVTPWIPWILA